MDYLWIKFNYMWQRIQTVFLLISVVVAVLFLFMPMAEMNENETFVGKDGIFSALAIAIGLISIFAVTQFKNRKLQMRLCMLNIIFSIVLFTWALLFINSRNPSHIFYEYLAGMPAVIVIALLFAYRNIRKDEELVRSMDRMR